MLKSNYRIDIKKVVKIKNSVLYYRSLYYVILMALFGIFGYIFLDSGFNTKTMLKVDYRNQSIVDYNVQYNNDEYTADGDNYISNMVSYIDFDFKYDNLLSEYVSGFYRYNVEAYLVAYEEDVQSTLWERKHYLINEKTELLDKNDINEIKIEDSFRINFQDYRDEIEEFIETSKVNVSGYLNIRINIMEFFDFNSLDNQYADNKVISINVPLSDDIFEIKIQNVDDKDRYYEFTNKESMNIVMLIMGTFCLSVSVSLGILVVRQFKIIYNRQSRYTRELKKILSKYDSLIVRVNKLYVNKKYNMIYVDSFSELLDVYNKVGQIINFRETKRGVEATFVIIDKENAWIYKLVSDDLE